MNFIWDWESQIVNQSGLQIDSSENWCHCEKIRAFLKKNSFTEGFFFPSKFKSSKKKESLQGKGSHTCLWSDEEIISGNWCHCEKIRAF